MISGSYRPSLGKKGDTQKDLAEWWGHQGGDDTRIGKVCMCRPSRRGREVWDPKVDGGPQDTGGIVEYPWSLSGTELDSNRNSKVQPR